MFRLLLLFTFCITFSVTNAQKSRADRREERKKRISTLAKQEEEGVIAYRKQTSFGIKLTSDGYGAFLEVGRALTVRKSNLFQFEMTERKSHREEKQSGVFNSSYPFIYGKQNFVYDVKLGMQRQMLLGNKTNKNGVSISGNFGGGINLGLLRPYYLQVYDVNTSTLKFVKYNSADSALFLNSGLIAGGPGLGKGWSEIQLNPGLYARTSIRFDYGKYNELVRALEVGVGINIYSKKLEEIVYDKQKKVYIDAHVALIFGGRK